MSGDAKYICGMEGGGTFSNLVICDFNQKVVAKIDGLGTNPFILGRTECALRIIDMVNKGKKEAGISESEPLACLSLCLSGCEEKTANELLEKELRTLCPTLMERCLVHSDTMASMATVTDFGGMVLITGTGSNAILRNPDGAIYNCGGWGHLLGEKGSAWWISSTAIITVIEAHDEYSPCPFSTNKVWADIKEYFNIKERLELLHHFYDKFEKNKVAGLCEKLAKSAESGDALCKFIFKEAGKCLARHVTALLPLADDRLLDDYLTIVCVGSVWKSWQLLRDGFADILDDYYGIATPFVINLVQLNVPASIGAIYLAADDVKLKIKKDFDINSTVFFRYHRT